MSLQRIDNLIADARKKLDKSIAKRDAAINDLTKAATGIKLASRALGRLEKRRRDLRAEQRTAERGAAKRRAEDGPLPPL